MQGTSTRRCGEKKAAYRIRVESHHADSTGGFRFQSEDLLDSSTLSDYILTFLAYSPTLTNRPDGLSNQHTFLDAGNGESACAKPEALQKSPGFLRGRSLGAAFSRGAAYRGLFEALFCT